MSWGLFFLGLFSVISHTESSSLPRQQASVHSHPPSAFPTSSHLRFIPGEMTLSKLSDFSLCIAYKDGHICSLYLQSHSSLLEPFDLNLLLTLPGVDRVCLVNNHLSLNCDISSVCSPPHFTANISPNWAFELLPEFFPRISFNPDRTRRSVVPDSVSKFLETQSPCGGSAILTISPFVRLDIARALRRERAPGQCRYEAEFTQSQTDYVFQGLEAYEQLILVVRREGSEGLLADVCLGVFYDLSGEGKLLSTAEGSFYTAVRGIDDLVIEKPPAVLIDTGSELTWIDQTALEREMHAFPREGKEKIKQKYWDKLCVKGFCEENKKLTLEGGWVLEVESLGISERQSLWKRREKMPGIIGMGPGSLYGPNVGVESIGFKYASDFKKGEIDVSHPRMNERCKSDFIVLANDSRKHWIARMTLIIMTGDRSETLVENGAVFFDTGWTHPTLTSQTKNKLEEFFGTKPTNTGKIPCPSPSSRLILVAPSGYKLAIPLELLYSTKPGSGACSSILVADDDLAKEQIDFVIGARILRRLYVVFNKTPLAVILCVPPGALAPALAIFPPSGSGPVSAITGDLKLNLEEVMDAMLGPVDPDMLPEEVSRLSKPYIVKPKTPKPAQKTAQKNDYESILIYFAIAVGILGVLALFAILIKRRQ